MHGIGARIEHGPDLAHGPFAISRQCDLAHEAVRKLPCGHGGFLEFTALISLPYSGHDLG